jgi:GntR family transcriptional repressor for pyruvate dehydrogenase complex
MERHLPSVDSDPSEDRRPEPPITAIRPARRRGLAHEVAEQLVELIAASPSTEVALPAERQLCEQLEVSRNVLREALAALDQMGLIETRGKTRLGIPPRARVQRLSRLPADGSARELLADPIEVRRIIEPATAALAATRADAEAIAEIERWLDLMEAGAAADRSVVDEDAGFHVAVARATENQMLIDLVGALGDALRHSRELSFRPADATAGAIADHRAILDAIRAADPEAARRAMGDHLTHVESLIRSTMRPAG